MRVFPLTVALAVVTAAALPSQNVAPTLVLRHATVIDGLAAEPLRDASVIIRNGRIEQIIAGSVSIPTGATILDLKGRWRLPRPDRRARASRRPGFRPRRPGFGSDHHPFAR